VVDDLPLLLPAAVIQVGAAVAAVDLGAVRRVVAIEDVCPVPLAPSAVLGVSLVTGTPVLIVDLERLASGAEVDEPARPPARVVGLLCRAGGELVVLAGAQVRAVERLRATRARPSAEGLGRWAGAAAEWRGAIVPILDVRAALDHATGRDSSGAAPAGAKG
jgi:chemotaxis signal transduction protein